MVTQGPGGPGGFRVGPTTLDTEALQASFQRYVLDQQAMNENLASFGLWTSAAGAALAAVGTYYAMKSQAAQLRSQELSDEHRATIASINARAAEDEAQAILEAGETEAALLSLEYGKMKSAQRTTRAGRGIEGGGSAAEVQASIEYSKKVDIYQTKSNAVRAANAARAQRTNLENESRMASVSANNIRVTRRSLNPALGAGTSLLSSASLISDQWLARNRYRFRPTYAS